METVVLKVRGMTCNHCRMSVEEALRGIAGVQSADVSLEKGEARVVYDPARTGLDAMRAAVQEAGYEVAGTASA